MKSKWLESYQLRTRTGFPAGFFRYLFRVCDVGIGSRVGVEGDREGRLYDYLNFLGFIVVDLDSFASSETSNSSDCGTDEPLELIISDTRCETEASLFSENAVNKTAELLSSLKPGGTGVFVSTNETGKESGEQSGKPEQHSIICYLNQLECFPGRTDLTSHRSNKVSTLLHSLIFQQKTQNVQGAYIRIPEYSITHQQWRTIAQNAFATHPKACCGQPLHEVPSIPLRKAA